ncbi:hypothetical protein SNE40_003746 [Patella caerulea]
MATRKFKDRSGCELGPYIEYDGILFPILPIKTPLEQHLNNIANLEIRPDDILISAYPKSGTHWVWEMVRMLISGSPEHIKDSKVGRMLEFKETKTIDDLPSPRLLNTHLNVRHLPKQIFTKGTKIVHVYRNPKDIAVSFYCHATGIKRNNGYSGTFHDFLDMFLREKVAFGNWGDYIKEWEEVFDKGETPIKAVAYEDMKKNPVKHLKEIATFLELDVTDELCAAIVDACSFSKMKPIAETLKEKAVDITWKEGSSIFRKGQVGDWKNWITVAENERFDEFIETKMKESDMKFIYTL